LDNARSIDSRRPTNCINRVSGVRRWLFTHIILARNSFMSASDAPITPVLSNSGNRFAKGEFIDFSATKKSVTTGKDRSVAARESIPASQH
jgi:hypothetical protein